MERNRINLASSLSMVWLPAAGLGVAALGAVVSLAMLLTGTPLESIATPLAVMVGLGAAIALISGAVVGLSVAWETRQIRGLLESAWASWPVYKDEAAWRTAREARYQRERENAQFSIVPLVVLGVFAAVVVGVMAFFIFPQNRQFMEPGDETLAYLAVGGAFGLIAVAVSLNGLIRRRQAEGRHAFRQSIQMPTVYIGQSGLYRDDEGYQSLRGLRSVTLKSGVLRFKTEGIVLESQQRYRRAETISVPTPAASVPDAEALIERFKREVL